MSQQLPLPYWSVSCQGRIKVNIVLFFIRTTVTRSFGGHGRYVIDTPIMTSYLYALNYRPDARDISSSFVVFCFCFSLQNAKQGMKCISLFSLFHIDISGHMPVYHHYHHSPYHSSTPCSINRPTYPFHKYTHCWHPIYHAHLTDLLTSLTFFEILLIIGF